MRHNSLNRKVNMSIYITENEFLAMVNKATETTVSQLDEVVADIESDMEIKAILEDPKTAVNRFIKRSILFNANRS